jgi:hypothetical protein
MRLSNGLRALACVGVLSVLATSASAKLVISNLVNTVHWLYIPGVSSKGTADWTLERPAHRDKVYNYTKIDLLVEVAAANVTNKSGKVYTDRNTGTPIPDLVDNVLRVSTSDTLVIGARKGTNKAPASWILVHNPALVPSSPN